MSKKVFQALFNKATSRVIRQGEIATDTVGNCVLRARLGNSKVILKCAVGHLVTNKQLAKYGVDAGGVGAFPQSLLKELAPKVNPERTRSFLTGLQCAHDRAKTPKTFVVDFTKAANEIAIEYGLTPIKS